MCGTLQQIQLRITIQPLIRYGRRILQWMDLERNNVWQKYVESIDIEYAPPIISHDIVSKRRKHAGKSTWNQDSPRPPLIMERHSTMKHFEQTEECHTVDEE
jgi:hypothetical protein